MPTEVALAQHIDDVALDCIGYLEVRCLARSPIESSQCFFVVQPVVDWIPSPDTWTETSWDELIAKTTTRVSSVATDGTQKLTIPIPTGLAHVLIARHRDLLQVMPAHPAWVGTATRTGERDRVRHLIKTDTPLVCPLSETITVRPGETRSVEIRLQASSILRFLPQVENSTEWTLALSWYESTQLGQMKTWKPVAQFAGPIPMDPPYLDQRVHSESVRFAGFMRSVDEHRYLLWSGEVPLDGITITTADAMGPYRISLAVELYDGEGIGAWKVSERASGGRNEMFVIQGPTASNILIAGLGSTEGTVTVESGSGGSRRKRVVEFDLRERTSYSIR
ncbi:MAG: hypothetical protein AB7I19_13450 [Planctomycetota bacterium]